MAPPTGSGPSTDQVDIAAKLKGLFESMAASSAAIEKSLQGQVESTRQMVDAMGDLKNVPALDQLTQMNSTLTLIADAVQKLAAAFQGTFTVIITEGTKATDATNNISSGVGRISQALGGIRTGVVKDLTQGLNQGGTSAEKFKDKITKATKTLKDAFAPAIGAATGALSGLKKGFENFLAMSTSIFGFLTAVAETIADIGFSILSLPFKMFDKLIEMANNYMNQITPLQEAINNIRKEFGALAGPIASTIQSTANSMKGLSDVGISAFKVFGNLAERTKLITDLMKEGGPAVRKFGQEFNEAGGAILGMQRGLGLSNEELGNLGTRSIAAGVPLTRTLTNITKQAEEMGRQFNIDVKTISRSMVKAMGDARAFGNVSDKAIAAAATQAERLGISLDKVTASLDNFQTFDQAAENVSKFNEVFGTSLDAMEMMNAETAMDQMELVRKQLAKVGIQGEKLSRVHRNLIQQTMGWDDATTIAAFSTSNYANSLSDVNKAAGEAESKTMSQEEALSKLADGMDGVLKALQTNQGGFFDKFFEGMSDGIQYSGEFRELMGNLKMSLIDVYWAGKRLGLVFIEAFPGLKKMVDGLTAIFDPKNFRNLTNGINSILLEFFDSLENGKASFPALMERLKDKFFNFFDAAAPGGRQFLEGLKTFGLAFSTILAQGVKWALETMTAMLRSIVDFIRDPSKIPGAGDVADAAVSFTTPIIQAFQEAVPAFIEAFQDLLSVVWDSIGNWFMTKALPALEPYLPIVAVIIFGPAFTQAFLGAFVGAMTTVFIQGIGMAATKAAAMAASGALGGPIAALAGKVGSLLGSTPTVPTPASGSAVPDIGPNAGKALKNLEIKISWKTVKNFLAGFAGVMLIGITAFAIMAMIASQFEMETIIKAGIMMTAIALAALATVPTMLILSKVKIDMKNLLAGLFALAATMGALVLIGFAIGALVSVADPKKLLMGAAVVTVLALAATIASVAMLGLMGVGAFMIVTEGTAAAALAAGFGALVITTAALVLFGKALVEGIIALGFKKQDLLDASIVFGAIVAAATAGVVALGAFMAIGGAILATFIIGGATMIATGIGAVYVALNSLLGFGKKLILAAKEMPDGLETKVEVFVSALKAISGILEGVLVPLTAMNLDEVDDLSSAADVLDKMKETSGAVFVSIKGIIDKLLDAAKSLSIVYDAEKSLGILVKALEAVAKLGPIISMTSIHGQAIKSLSSFNSGAILLILDRMKDFVKTIKDVVIGLIREVVKIVSSPDLAFFNANPQSIDAIGQMLTGMGALLTALANPSLAKAFEKIDSGDFEKMPAVIDAMARYATKIIEELVKPGGMIEMMSKFLPKLIYSIGSLYITDSTIKGLEAITSLLKTVFDFTSKLIEVALAGGNPSEDSARRAAEFMKSIGVTVGTIILSLADAMPDVIKNLAPVIALAESVSSKSKDFVGSVSALQAIISLMMSVGSLTFNFNKNANVLDEASVQRVMDSAKIIMKIFGSLGKELFTGNMLKGFISTLDTIATSLFGVENITAKLEIAVQAFKFITSLAYVAQMLNSLAWSSSGGQTINTDIIVEQFRSLGKLFEGIAANDIMGTISQSVSKITNILSGGITESSIPTIDALTRFISALGKNGPSLNDSFAALAGQRLSNLELANPAMTNVEIFMKTFAAHAGLFENMTDKALAVKASIAEGMIPAVEAVEMMIEAGNRLNSALDKGLVLNFDTKLKTFVSKFGKTMGSNAAYKVQAKDVVIIANFRVAIDSTELERIMVTNGKSVIKQRLNMIMNAIPEASTDTGTGLLPTDREGGRLRSNVIPVDMATFDY